MSLTNPFAQADAWDVSGGEYLGIGEHLVEIESAEDDTAGTNNPQVKLVFRNENGMKPDWCTYHENFLAKVVALYDSAGVARPGDGEFDPNDHCRIKLHKIKELVGRKLVIVVRNEKDNRDPTKEYPRVKGYKPASEADVSVPDVETPSSAADDDIPF